MINISKIICLLGAGGSGKTTIGNYMKEILNIPEIISYTTRDKRKGEVDGYDYHFVDKINKEEMAEFIKRESGIYGFKKKDIDEGLKKNNSIFLIAEINGIKQLKKIYGNKINIVFISATKEECKKRMLERGDSVYKVKERLKEDINNLEYNNWIYADFIIRNKQDRLYYSCMQMKNILNILNC
ncbi:MAG: guanylate kinase [bacterium]